MSKLKLTLRITNTGHVNTITSETLNRNEIDSIIKSIKYCIDNLKNFTEFNDNLCDPVILSKEYLKKSSIEMKIRPE